MDALRGSPAPHVGLIREPSRGHGRASAMHALLSRSLLRLHSMDIDGIPSAGPAHAADTVTSQREGCKSNPLRAARPARHRLACMRERARDQGGPGTLTDDLVIPEVDPSSLADEPLAELADRYRLRPSAARPGVFVYARQLWERRHFIVSFATARNVAMYTEARLGQLWQVLTTLLNAAVYYLIFGIILNTSRGVPNFLAFLVTGIFIFNFTQRAFITTSRVMPDSLPLSLARLGAGADDFSQLLPFLIRTWLYFSGVMFSIQTIGSLRHHHTLTYLLQVNPAAVYIGLVRNSILQSQRIGWPGSKPYSAGNCALYHTGKKAYLEYSAYCHGTVSMNGLWLWGIGWAIVAVVVGFVFFWQAETRYGRG